MNKTNKIELSVIIPLYNETENILPLFTALNKLKNKLPLKTEFILIDDGSSDDTLKTLKVKKLLYKKTILSFSKNFGHQSALLAGLNHSSGDLIITMDGDLQHPPHLIPSLIKLSEQGYDIVLTKRIDNQVTNGFKKKSSLLFYKLINFFSDTKIHESGSDFRLLNRKALKSLLDLPESNKFLRGLVSWIGYKTIILPFEVEERAFGSSKYSFKKMLRLALSGLTSFSTFPLYITGILGLILTFLSIIYAIFILFQFFANETVNGWASHLLVTLTIGSFTFISLGIIGIYLAKIYEEVKKRPDYIIDSITKK